MLFTATPVDINFAVENPAIKAIVHAYSPALWGGRAVAELLAGVFSPAGRLPYTYVKGASTHFS